MLYCGECQREWKNETMLPFNPHVSDNVNGDSLAV